MGPAWLPRGLRNIRTSPLVIDFAPSPPSKGLTDAVGHPYRLAKDFNNPNANTAPGVGEIRDMRRRVAVRIEHLLEAFLSYARIDPWRFDPPSLVIPTNKEKTGRASLGRHQTQYILDELRLVLTASERERLFEIDVRLLPPRLQLEKKALDVVRGCLSLATNMGPPGDVLASN
jgi:hypothetical protein